MRMSSAITLVLAVSTLQSALGLELVATQAASSISVCGIQKATGAIISDSCGVLARIGPRDLASNPLADSLVWAVTQDFFGDDMIELVGIDPTRPAIASRTLIEIDEPIYTLAIDAKGGFYATTSSQLVRLEPNSGEVTVIGETLLSVDKGLAFNSAGALYGIGDSRHLVQINTGTGAATTIGQLDDVIRIEDLAFDPKNDDLYGIGYDGEYRLYSVDVMSATTSVIGPTLFRPSGLAFATLPEPGSLVLVLPGALTFLVTRTRRTW